MLQESSLVSPDPARRPLQLSRSDSQDDKPLGEVLAGASPEQEGSPELEITGRIEPAPVIPVGQMLVPYPFNKWALTCDSAVAAVTT